MKKKQKKLLTTIGMVGAGMLLVFFLMGGFEREVVDNSGLGIDSITPADEVLPVNDFVVPEEEASDSDSDDLVEVDAEEEAPEVVCGDGVCHYNEGLFIYTGTCTAPDGSPWYGVCEDYCAVDCDVMFDERVGFAYAEEVEEVVE